MSDRPEQSSPEALRRALVALRDMRSKLDAAERAAHESIAVVGMACRFPGQADTPAAFWQLLDRGDDAVREVPANRWDADAFYDADPDAPGKTYTRHGGFLDDVTGFDAGFFGITPREAASLDPQQRLLLEVSWEALENAGIAPKSVVGSRTGVYVGFSASDFGHLMVNERRIDRVDPYVGTGSAACVAAGRVSFFFGFRGPALSVDTACSSSLVAIDLAVRDLRSGRADVALAGGVNLMLSPMATIYMSKLRALSPTGKCHTFDADADGYVRGEGCGMVVLKRLSAAREAGDRVLAIVLGSAVNHDGRSSGLTVPNIDAQEALLKDALADAQLESGAVDYVEAHGTGTLLGDPIEVRALGAVYAAGRQADRPLLVGTVKTNLGHLEAAAGVAGFMKVVLALQHGRIPPSLHFRKPNAHIPFGDLGVSVVAHGQPWPERGRPPIAGVSAFGFSGTNAHVLVQAAGETAPDAVAVDRPAHVLTLSAATDGSLRQLAERFAREFGEHPETPLGDAAFTANAGRSHFDHRVAVVARSTDEARTRLSAFVAGSRDPFVVAGDLSQRDTPKTAWLFTGQGSQYLQMGRRLYHDEPTFRAVIDECDEAFRALTNRSLLPVMYPDDPGPADPTAAPLNETGWAQPALFALELALARLYQSWGLKPAAVLGHSVGEYTAACVAGVFNAADGLRLVAERGRLMQALPPGGRMVSVPVSESRAREAITRVGGQVAIAAVNGRDLVVVSGADADVARVLGALGEAGANARALVVSHAFHSPLMAPMLEAFGRALSTVRFNKPKLRVVSNVTGSVASDMATPDYWLRHVMAPVRFAPSIEYLLEQGIDTFLELGPQPTLTQLGESLDSSRRARWIGSLRRGRDDWDQILTSVAELYASGAAIDWQAFDRPYRRARVALPTYAFERTPYDYERMATDLPAPVGAAQRPPAHPLLEAEIRSVRVPQTIVQAHVSSTAPGFVADHRIYGQVIFPLSGYIEMVLAALRSEDDSQTVELRDVSIEAPLVLADDDRRLLQLVLEPESHGQRAFEILSAPESSAPPRGNEWVRHMTGTVARAAAGAATLDLNALQSEFTEAADVDSFYSQLASAGVEYGPSFRTLAELRRSQAGALGLIRAPREHESPFVVHPGMLDAAFQVLGAALARQERQDEVSLPIGFSRLRIATRPVPAEAWSRAIVDAAPAGGAQQVRTGDISWVAGDGRTVLEIERFAIKRAPLMSLRRTRRSVDDTVYRVEWQKSEAGAGTAVAGHTSGSGWIILADERGLAERLVPHLAGPTVVIRRESTSGTDLARTLSDAVAAMNGCRGIVHAWAIDSPGPSADGKSLLAFQEPCCGVLTTLARLATDRATPLSLVVITAGAHAVAEGDTVDPAQAPVWAMAGTWANELTRASLRIDVDLSIDATDVSALAREIEARWTEDQVALRGDSRYVCRLVRALERRPSDALWTPGAAAHRLVKPKSGRLDQMVFEPLARRPPADDEVEIAIRASGLNFRDVMNVLGVYPGEAGPVGVECAGTITAVGANVKHLAPGDEVFGLAGGSFATHVVTPAALVIRRPTWLTPEDAAALPVCFLTAWYGFHRLARIKPGDRVLVHAAAGGVGIAAIMVARAAGAEVFGTAGTPEKRRLAESFGATRAFDSRKATFGDELRSLTGGRGVDIVLNSLTGEFIGMSLAAMAPGGRFLEIGKTEIWDAARVRAVNPAVSYTPFDVGEVAARDPGAITTMLGEIVEALADGRIQRLPRRSFELPAIGEAFRFMAQAKHVGKIVFTRHDRLVDAGSKVPLDPEAAYLVTGGFGGIGTRLLPWLAERGARHIAVVTRSKRMAAAPTVVEQCEAAGATVYEVNADLSTDEGASRVRNAVGALGRPLKGVLHAAGVLDDGLLTQQTWERIERVMAPKIVGAQALHQLTAAAPLDFFILFSSTSAVFGAPAQGSYAAGNAFLDALADHRRALGLPALSINWGPWSEVGMAARLDGVGLQRIREQGFVPLAPDAGLEALAHLLPESGRRVVLDAHWPKVVRVAGRSVPLLQKLADAAGPVAAHQPAESLMERLRAMAPAERERFLVGYVAKEVARIASLPSAENLDTRAPLHTLGVDSLMLVELRNALATAVGRPLDATLVYDYPSVSALGEFLASTLNGDSGPGVAGRSGDAPQTAMAPAQAPAATGSLDDATGLLERLGELSDESVDELLKSMLADGDTRR